MLCVALALAAAILLVEAGLFPSRQWVALIVALSFGLVIVGAFIRSRWTQIAYPVALTCCLVCLGALWAGMRQPRDPFPAGGGDTAQTLLLRIEDTPRPTARCLKFPAEVEAVLADSGWVATRGRIMLYLQRDSVRSNALRYGDRLVVRTSPKVPSEDYHGFNYRRYLRHRGMLWQCYVPGWAWQQAGRSGRGGLVGWSKALQLRLVGRFRQMELTPSQQGLAEALLLGWRDDLAEATQRQFRDAGITHLLCVSGLHVGVIAMLAGWLLFFLGRLRWQRIVRGVVQLSVVWLFVLVTGMAPSTLRSGIMFSMLIIGDMFTYRGNSLNNLGVAAVILLCIDPWMLFDVGFQLSFVAVLGILLWQQPLQHLLPIPQRGVGWRCVDKVWEWVCLSTAAQLATLPLVLYYFHQFPLYFLIANLLIVPFSGLLLATLLLVLLFGGWALVPLRWEFAAVDAITSWVGALPHALLSDIPFDLIAALLLSLALLLFTPWIRHRRSWFLPATLAILLLFAVYVKLPPFGR